MGCSFPHIQILPVIQAQRISSVVLFWPALPSSLGFVFLVQVFDLTGMALCVSLVALCVCVYQLSIVILQTTLN